MRLIRAASYEDMSRKAASLIASQVIMKPDSILGLATGSTPIGLYALLAEWHSNGDLDFSALTTFNLDEYCGLTPDNPQSYQYFMNKHLFNKVNIDRKNAYLPDGSAADIQKECERYEALVKNNRIDLQLLGIGNNGHIGFNEPAESFAGATHCVTLDETTINANARFFDNPADVPHKAVTMGIGTIMSAKKILLVASGTGKKNILEKAMNGPITPKVPASILQLHRHVTVIASV